MQESNALLKMPLLSFSKSTLDGERFSNPVQDWLSYISMWNKLYLQFETHKKNVATRGTQLLTEIKQASVIPYALDKADFQSKLGELQHRVDAEIKHELFNTTKWSTRKDAYDRLYKSLSVYMIANAKGGYYFKYKASKYSPNFRFESKESKSQTTVASDVSYMKHWFKFRSELDVQEMLTSGQGVLDSTEAALQLATGEEDSQYRIELQELKQQLTIQLDNIKYGEKRIHTIYEIIKSCGEDIANNTKSILKAINEALLDREMVNYPNCAEELKSLKASVEAAHRNRDKNEHAYQLAEALQGAVKSAYIEYMGNVNNDFLSRPGWLF